jgi:TnpA family transposase
MAKVVNVLSPAQRAKLLQNPEDFPDREMVRYYTLSPEDKEIIAEHRRAPNRVGFAVQLAYLRYPGRAWHPEEQVPPAVLTYLTRQIDESPEALAEYATRDPTRREHLSELQRRFGFRSFSLRSYRQLSHWLMPIALSTDEGMVLVEALIEELRTCRIIAPALSTLERLAWETRRRAQQQVYTTLTASLSEEQTKRLDTLLIVPAGEQRTPLVWLREPPGPAKPATFLKVMERLQLIRELGVDPTVARQIHANRLRRLAREGEQYSPQFLARFDAQRRYAMLVASLVELEATLTDTALEMHDRIMGNLFRQGQQKQREQFAQRGQLIHEKVRLYARVGKALITAKEQAADPYQAVEAVVPWEQFVASVEEAGQLAHPRGLDYLDFLDDSYSQIRKYSPTLLGTFTFHASPPLQPLVEALELIRDLGRKSVPEQAPTAFVKPRWQEHVWEGEKINRHYYELCALAELRNGLRSGDLWVERSQQYRPLEDYLLPPETWKEMRSGRRPPISAPLDAKTYLAERGKELDDQLTRVGKLLKENALPDVRRDAKKVRITPLDAEVPEGVEELARRAYAKVRPIKITQLLVEIDQVTHFSRHCTHLHRGDPARDLVTLFAALLAEATNLGLANMAAATPGMTKDRMSWFSDWYLRDECYTKMRAEIVNYHHRHPFSTHWGDGTTSFSWQGRIK